MQKSGYRCSTIGGCVKALRALARRTNLYDPEAARAYLGTAKLSESRKEKIADDLARFYRYKRLPFEKPHYRRVETLPFLPQPDEVEMLISGAGPKTAAFLEFLKETAARPGEAWNLRSNDLDHERSCVRIIPEKNSRPRERKVTLRLMSMLENLRRHDVHVFHGDDVDPIRSLEHFRRNFLRQRRKVAEKLQNPRILHITFGTLRHLTASLEYRKTKDLVHVMQILGHKNIKNTLIYTHMIGESEEFVCKVAGTLDEAKTLVEGGFEYVTDLEGAKLFRKRK
jgi:integrase